MRSRLIAWVCVLPVLAGCATGFIYQRMDTVVSWYVDDYVTLDTVQEAELRRIVRGTLKWHRREQLPQYVALLEDMAAQAHRPHRAEEIEARYQQFRGEIEQFLLTATPAWTPLLRTLSPQQRIELEQAMADELREQADEIAELDADERRERRDDEVLKVLQRFVGRLDREQRDLVIARLAGLQDVTEQRLERRRDWQREFFGLIDAVPPEAELQSALRRLVIGLDPPEPPGYRRQMESNRDVIVAMLADVSATLNDSQRQRLREKLLELAADVQRISEAG